MATKEKAYKIPEEEVATVLERALELMNNSGAHWTKGTFQGKNDNDETNYCSVGAIQKIVTGSAEAHWNSSLSNTREGALVEKCIEALAGAYGKKAVKKSPRDVVIQWNDRSSTKWTAVTTRFKRAASRVRKGKA